MYPPRLLPRLWPLMLTATVVGGGCRHSPSSPPTPEPAAAAEPAKATTTGSASASPVVEPTAAVADDLPRTCELTVAYLEPGGVTGRGAADAGATAKDAAWTEACAALKKTHGLDCHDSDRTAIRAERSMSIQSQRGDGSRQTLHKHSVTLTPRRVATGFGDAMDDHEQACRNARANACQTLVGGPCPDEDIRVLAVDGQPPRSTPRPATAPEQPHPTI